MDLSIVSAGLFMEMDVIMANRHMSNEEAAERFLTDGLKADWDILMEALAACCGIIGLCMLSWPLYVLS